MKKKQKQFIKFLIVAFLYLLFVIWLENYWFLPGLIVIFDVLISKRINWTFWKKNVTKDKPWTEWIEALIYALLAVIILKIFAFQNFKIPTSSMEKTLFSGDYLFVSKLAYGPKMPNTPIAFPFTHNTLPFTAAKKSYLEWIKLPYKRLKGFGKIKRNDIVVFNFPAGDTVILEMTAQSYESIIRGYAEQLKQQDRMAGNPIKSADYYYSKSRQFIWDQYNIITRPVDRRDIYIKRCLGLPGDSLQIINGKVFVNHLEQKPPDKVQFKYRITTNGTPINQKLLEKMNISLNDIRKYSNTDFVLPLTFENKNKIASLPNVIKVSKIRKPKNGYANYTFPHDPRFPWNEDNLGPIYVPKKNDSVLININNLPLYKNIIRNYEGNILVVRDSSVFINGDTAQYYTFKMDYYFMLGDNRHDSSDSRFWGFVPENHIVGKPIFVWFSINGNKTFLKKMRWKRVFNKI